MDVRLTTEQRQLRDAAAKLADDLGPGSVQDLSDEGRIARLEKAVDATGWRSLRSDGASGVEVAIVAEEFGRGLVDVPFLGPALADELHRRVGGGAEPATLGVDGQAVDARGFARALDAQRHQRFPRPALDRYVPARTSPEPWPNCPGHRRPSEI